MRPSAPQSGGGISIGQVNAQFVNLVNSQAKKAKPQLPYEPELIEVPAGPFLMGSGPGEGIPAHETPLHQVELSAFLISKTPVTNAQYETFIRLSRREAPKGWLLRRPPEPLLDHPVTNVSWHDAAAYCAWLSQESGRPYRLPTEAEWEKAARSSDGRCYPWGNDWQEDCCNCGSSQTTPVTAFPNGASPHGCLDMLGNVREWTATIWGSSPAQTEFPYPFAEDGRNALSPGSGPVFRICRGGCFRDQPPDLRCAARSFSAENSKLAWCGFRVVMELP